MRHVIVGGGIAGTTLAEELRKLRANDEIVLVSQEQHPCYSRVLLPHYLKNKVPRGRVFLKTEAWYTQQRIEWLRGMVVDELDANNRFVRLSDGRELPYDTLTLAVGGDVRTVPGDPRGVSYLRTLDDADHLNELLRSRKLDARAVVYGGGFISCEYINVFAYEQIPTTVLTRGPYFWTGTLDEESGGVIADRLRSRGVTYVPGSDLPEAVGEHELEAVQTTSGRIPCCLLGVGVGIETDLSWAREADLEIGAAIRADSFLRTNLPDVYAIGDGVEFYDVVAGRALVAGNWLNAIQQARTVAKTITGTPTEFRQVTSYATNILGLELIFIGDVSAAAAHEAYTVGTRASGAMTRVFFRNDRIVGAAILGRIKDRPILTKLIEGQAPFSSKNLETTLG